MARIIKDVTHPVRSIGVDSAKYLLRSVARTEYGSVLLELGKCLKTKVY
jgi:hypothetical protein